MRKQVRNAFTLVEILIVVVILGILAAIVVPQFTNATQDAQAGNIKAQLDTLNNQIELYRAKMNGYPSDLVTGGTGNAPWQLMIDGGYIKTAPKNPFNGSSDVGTAVTGGWHWYDANGDGTDDSIGATNFDESTGLLTPGVL